MGVVDSPLIPRLCWEVGILGKSCTVAGNWGKSVGAPPNPVPMNFETSLPVTEVLVGFGKTASQPVLPKQKPELPEQEEEKV